MTSTARQPTVHAMCRAGPDEQLMRSKFSARGSFSEKNLIQMITLIARFRFIAMEGKKPQPGSGIMKNKKTETKFESGLGAARHSFAKVVFWGAVILTCSSALAQSLFVSDVAGGNIYEFTPGGLRTTF